MENLDKLHASTSTAALSSLLLNAFFFSFFLWTLGARSLCGFVDVRQNVAVISRYVVDRLALTRAPKVPIGT